MSDETIAAPAAEAPVADAAPAEKSEAVEKAPPKPRTIDDDLEDVLKKHGGYKYKASGKEKSVEKAADLKRMLSKVDGLDSVASEALKKSQRADAIEAGLAGIAKLPPRERLKALEALGVPKKLLREATEEDILEEDAREKSQAHLSEREKAAQRRIDEQEAELAGFRESKQRQEQEQEESAQVARITEVGQRLERVTVAALQKAKVQPGEAPQYLEAIAKVLDRNERLGLGLDEDELAEVVVNERETSGRGWLKGKAAPDLADVLEAEGAAKGLMEEFARRIRAKRDGGTPAPQRVSQSSPQQGSQTLSEKMAAARNFGGGR